MIEVTLYTDAACPWAYSANPSLRVLEWWYGEQLAWRLVTIGLREDASGLTAQGYDPVRAAKRQMMFRRRSGMPFSLEPKEPGPVLRGGAARGGRAAARSWK